LTTGSILFFSILHKIIDMKTAGWLLLVIGIVMIIIKGFSVPVEKKVIDVGPIEVNKTENKWIGWPTYAGGILAVLGVVLVVAGKKK
jgi:hypothetical protein